MCTPHDNASALALSSPLSCLNDDLSPIPQLDGALSPDQLVTRDHCHQSPNTSHASFTMNTKKQLTRLCKDTTLDDYEITVSPIAHNVNIKCSAGFYAKVVLPSLGNIAEQYDNHVDGVSIQCTEVKRVVDGAGASVTGTVVFKLSYLANQSFIGTVHIHLHHTTRRVQLQGSSLVHNKTRAPVWFVDKFLKGIFSQHANTMALNISKFNTAVHTMLTDHLSKINNQEKCGLCGSLFDGRSTKMKCSSCSKNLHKSCFQDKKHACQISQDKVRAFHSTLPAGPDTSGHLTHHVSTPILDNQPPSDPRHDLPLPIPAQVNHTLGSAQGTPLPLPRTAPILVGSTPSSCSPSSLADPLANTLLCSPVITTYPASATSSYPATASGSVSASSSTSMIATRTDTAPISYPGLDHPTILHVPVPAVPPSQQETGTKSKTTQRKKVTNKVSQDLDLELAKIELNTAQTSITALENKIADLKFKNNLLEDRVKQLEAREKGDIFEKYFPSGPKSTQKSQQHVAQSPVVSCCHSTPRLSHCCSPPPCHTSCTETSNMVKVLSSLATTVDTIKVMLVNLQRNNFHQTQTENSMAISPSSPRQGSPPTPLADSAIPAPQIRPPPSPQAAAPLAPELGCPSIPSVTSVAEIGDTTQLNTSMTSIDGDMEDIDPDDLLNLE